MIKYILVFILSVCIASISQILLKKSANIERKNRIEEYLNVYVISSYGLLFVSTLLTLYAYTKVKLSTGIVLETISYILIPILSYFIIKENIEKRQIKGIILIIVGILIFSFV